MGVERRFGRQNERSKNVGEERKLGTGELISLFSEMGKLRERRWQKQKTVSNSKGRTARSVDVHLLAQTKKQNCNLKASECSKPVQAVLSNKIYGTSNKSAKVLIALYSLDPDLLAREAYTHP